MTPTPRWKRATDLVLAGGAVVALSPLLLLIAGAVRWKLGSPVLFRQERPGKGGVPFELLKFRTMTEARGPDGSPLPDGARLTPFGRLLRASSLDELPELWNVVRGEMSLVGPRPLLMEYLPRYSPEQARRHEVLPGLTGLAQIQGRNALGWEERFALDLEYIERRSLRLDLAIIARTVIEVLRRRGIAARADGTTPPFRGPDAPPPARRSETRR